MNIKKLNSDKLPIISIDNSLAVFKEKDIFEKKLKKANKILNEVGLPTQANLNK
jgi:hypothetical protein